MRIRLQNGHLVYILSHWHDTADRDWAGCAGVVSNRHGSSLVLALREAQGGLDRPCAASEVVSLRTCFAFESSLDGKFSVRGRYNL